MSIRRPRLRARHHSSHTCLVPDQLVPNPEHPNPNPDTLDANPDQASPNPDHSGSSSRF
jgi:hypothetical protein